jgi:integrase
MTVSALAGHHGHVPPAAPRHSLGGRAPPRKGQGRRHFYASGLIAAGCDVVTVQRALGHAKATTTLSTYAHL